uniref:Uncharacterized protein n=1 Tax=Anguilla anguilla TaxID=7936 RepID=A0A0E9RJR0_ANGAN
MCVSYNTDAVQGRLLFMLANIEIL